MARLRGFIWLIAGVVLALLAGLVAYTTLTRVAQDTGGAETAAPTVSVVAAARNIPVRTLLTAGDLIEIEMAVDTVPENAVRTMDTAVGRLTTAELFLGEPLLTPRLIDPNVVSADGRKAMFLLDDEVLMAIPAQDLMSRIAVLRPGDKVDLLFSLDFPANRGVGAVVTDEEKDDEEQATFTLLQNVTIAALIGAAAPPTTEAETGGTMLQQAAGLPDAVLLTLSPQDALTLKYVIDAEGTLDLVLRAPGVERPFITDPVDVDYLINRYRIPTGPGR